MNGLREINGFFAVIRHDGDRVWVATDKVRSIPLFYASNHSELYVSDDADWVCRQIGDTDVDDSAATEFLIVGYVTGQDTLFANISQLQAGEVLFATSGPAGWTVARERYYRYLHHDYLNEPEDSLLRLLDQTLLDVFKRLVRLASGRTIVVPLSGGYDSRLIASMLKRLGYKEVICYSYGIPNNWESRISHQVARHLGYEWHFVRFDRGAWLKWFSSTACREYRRFGQGLASIAHLQDWPAVCELKRLSLIPVDSLFVPGHAADFVAGSHIPPQFHRLPIIGADMTIACIIRHHYTLLDWSPRKDVLYRRFANRVSNLIRDIPCDTAQDAADAFEYWDWQERQAKFICNSVRVYEFFGYDWWLPFWDSTFMAFWERVPLALRRDEYLYLRYFDNEELPRIEVSARSLVDRVEARLLKLIGRDSLNGMSFAYTLPIGPVSYKHAASPNACFAAFQLRELGWKGSS